MQRAMQRTATTATAAVLLLVLGASLSGCGGVFFDGTVRGIDLKGGTQKVHEGNKRAVAWSLTSTDVTWKWSIDSELLSEEFYGFFVDWFVAGPEFVVRAVIDAFKPAAKPAPDVTITTTTTTATG